MSFAEGIICPHASQTCCDNFPLFGKIFPSPVFFSSHGEGTAVMKGLMGENKFSWARQWNRTYCRPSSCGTSPSYQRCSRSLGASISATVLKAPVTAGYNCHYGHPLYG